MACFHPLKAEQLADGSVVFFVRAGSDSRKVLELPCGQCVGCRLERSRQWAMRCVHEASLYEQNSFVTLTYGDEFLPEGGSLMYRDFQLFMKRLRRTRKGVRFFCAGEYGDELGRPHFHACLFNCGFSDGVLFSNRGGQKLFTSVELDGLWKLGFASFGSVTFESAAYVARYVMKKVTGDMAAEHYGDRLPEFCHMSLKPGIGARWLEKYRGDVFPAGKVVVNGVECKPPKFYERMIKKQEAGSDAYAELEMGRELEARASGKDRSVERLAVREQVVKARVSRLKRSL